MHSEPLAQVLVQELLPVLWVLQVLRVLRVLWATKY